MGSPNRSNAPASIDLRVTGVRKPPLHKKAVVLEEALTLVPRLKWWSYTFTKKCLIKYRDNFTFLPDIFIWP
jgi:hypothetical protein